MNKDKELEETIKDIKIYLNDWRNEAIDEDGYQRYSINDDSIDFINNIEIVLQALENLQEENRILKNRQSIGRFTEVNVENLAEVLAPYYIPKKKIEDKIEELKNKIKQNEKELRKKPEPVDSGFGSFDDYFKWKFKVIDENRLLKKEIKDIQELLKDK